MKKRISDWLMVVAIMLVIAGFVSATIAASIATIQILQPTVTTETVGDMLRALFIFGMVAANAIAISFLTVSRQLLASILESRSYNTE